MKAIRYGASALTLSSAVSLVLTAAAAPALAGETVLYGDAPAWVEKGAVPAPDVEPGKPFRHMSFQVRMADGVVWQYNEVVVALGTPELLTQMGTVTAHWIPDKGDLVVHQVALKRADRMIDILGQGARFDVLRREQQLEQRAIDGVRTASLVLPGAQQGDELHFAWSTSLADQAMGRQMQFGGVLLPDPMPLVNGDVTVQWPQGEDVRIGYMRFSDGPQPELRDGVYRVTVALPTAKPEDLPNGAPLRMQLPPMIQASTYDSYAAISAGFAPHYGLDDAGGDGTGVDAGAAALEARIAAIAQGDTDPVARAATALRLVQDEISYLANGLDGGNYLPQSPASTWANKYGDCKAKSVLLGYMLRRLGIDAQVALVRSAAGAALPDMLPQPGDFDHMIVRAAIDGADYWLDGTRTGDRVGNLRDTPGFRYALPIMAGGSDLVPIPAREPAELFARTAVTLDQRAGLALPAIFDLDWRGTGPNGATLRRVVEIEPGEERDDMVGSMVQSLLGPAQVDSYTVDYREDDGTGTIHARGLITTPWQTEDGRYRMDVPYQELSQFGFDGIDRARPEWRDIPVMVNAPYASGSKVVIELPQGGEGFRVLGDSELSQTIGGSALRSEGGLADGRFTLTQSVKSQAFEFPADQLAQVKRDVTRLQRRLPRLVAPTDARRAWQYQGEDRALLAPLETMLDSLVDQAEADDTSALDVRSSFRFGTGDWTGAKADLSTIIDTQPSAGIYQRRAWARWQLGDLDGALADLEQAEDLEPTGATYDSRVNLLGLLGRGADAVDLARDYAAFAQDPEAADRMVADAQGWNGQGAEGLRILNDLVAQSTDKGGLFNAICWNAGIWNVRPEEYREACDKAVALNSNAVAALDSRALLHFRLGEDAAALADLKTVLANAPDLQGSRYLRGLVRLRMGDAGGRQDIRQALDARPSLKANYTAWGLAPPQ